MIQPQITAIQSNNSRAGIPVSAERRKNLDDLTLKLIVGKVLPISTVYNNHFVDLVKELDPR